MKTIKVTVKKDGLDRAYIFYSYADMLQDTLSDKLFNAEEAAGMQYIQEHPELQEGDVTMVAEVFEMPEPELLVDDNHGIYVPEFFAKKFSERIKAVSYTHLTLPTILRV